MIALPGDAKSVFEHADRRRARRLGVFNPSWRRQIEQLVDGSAAFEDLADSFPALLFALATGYGTSQRRRTAHRRVINGVPLRTIAEGLGLPLWLRRVPAGAFCEPLTDFSKDPEFNQRIVSLVPSDDAEARVWLWGVSTGYVACGSSFALWAAAWLAKNARLFCLPAGAVAFRYLCAWAWHSDHPETAGFQLIRRPWSNTMGLRRALDELAVWRSRIDLGLCLDEREGEAWMRDGHANGYEFRALKTAPDFIVEADAMGNCLDTYADRLRQWSSHIYSVRKNGRRVAIVEISRHCEESGMPAIRQLRGPRNRRAAPEIWQAAHAWIGAQPLFPQPLLSPRSSASLGRVSAQRFWRPYAEWLEVHAPNQDCGDLMPADNRKEIRRTLTAPPSDSLSVVEISRPSVGL